MVLFSQLLEFCFWISDSPITSEAASEVASTSMLWLMKMAWKPLLCINRKLEGLTWSEGNPTAQTPRKIRSTDKNITEESSLFGAVRLEQTSWRKPTSQTAARAAQKLNTPKAQMTRADVHVDMLTMIVALDANFEITSIFWQQILSQQIRHFYRNKLALLKNTPG